MFNIYRLTFYYLFILEIVAIILGFLGKIPFSTWGIVSSSTILILSCLVFNFILAKIFNARSKIESVLITALILALIISPGLPALFLILVSLLAMASKYLLAIKGRHIFNPAAIAVVLAAFLLGQSANWWIGTIWMMPFVLIGGLIIASRLRRLSEVVIFIFGVLALLFFTYLFRSGTSSATHVLRLALTTSSLLFFSFAMLTEPLTAPSNKNLRLIFTALIAFLFVTPQLHPFGINLTPELALCFGNAFAFIYKPCTPSGCTLEVN